MFDVLISGGDLVDGTGGPRRRADVGIVDGRITEIGDLAGRTAHHTIDATGSIVAPGFIDVHTHLDAQAFWDTTLSPSPLHGVTTAIGGNCGFSIAPLGSDPADGQYLMSMLSRVEGMPLHSLQIGVPWNWDTTEEYLAAIDRTLSINTAFKVGHSALRRVVMGTAATEREATDEEVAAMCALLRDGLRAGAIGFSSSWSSTHNDTEGHAVPSRFASRHELLSLCSQLADFPGTSLEFIPMVGPFDQATVELLAEMSLAAQAPLNWNVLAVGAGNLADVMTKMDSATYAAERGAKVIGLTAPMSLDFRLSFIHGFLLDAVPGWEAAMLLPVADKIAALSDPQERARWGEIAARPHMLRKFTHWEALQIFHVVAPENEPYLGRLIGDIAAELGKSPWDTLCDIALADGLHTSFGPPVVEEPVENWEARVTVWRDGRAIVGASDAGAHLDMFFSANYATVLLHHAVAMHRLMPVEEAVALLTSAPADLYGLVGRGRLTLGAWADVVIFDEATIGSEPMAMRNDLPGGAPRLYAAATGISSVLCNGVVIVRDGAFTDARPGVVLRSGHDSVRVLEPLG